MRLETLNMPPEQAPGRTAGAVQKVVLFGNGQVAANTYAHLSQSGSYRVVAFTVDRAWLQETRYFDLPVVPFEEVETLFPPGEYAMQVSISYRGVNQLRAEKYAQAKAKGYRLITYIHPRAIVAPSAAIGDNCIIGANCVIDSFVRIGANVTVAGSCTIGHHTVIGDHCFLSAGAMLAGSTTVEPFCFIGTQATVRDRLVLGRSSVIGAGAVILEDTPPQSVHLARAAERLSIRSDQLPLG